VPDGRDPTRTRHSVADIFLARSLAIAAGYEDADDLDDLRHDPAFKMALGKAPDRTDRPGQSADDVEMGKQCRSAVRHQNGERHDRRLLREL